MTPQAGIAHTYLVEGDRGLTAVADTGARQDGSRGFGGRHRVLVLIALALLAASANPGTAFAAKKAVPPSFNSILVSATQWPGGNGVDVYSNGQSVPNYVCGEMGWPLPAGWTPADCRSSVEVSGVPRDVGLKWQCVELAQRYFNVRGWWDGHFVNSKGRGVGYAYEIWGGAARMGMRTYDNGSLSDANVRPGDLVVWKKNADFAAGHVAVVGAVTGSSVTIYEQNWGSTQTGTASYTLANGWLSRSGSSYPASYIYGVVHSPDNLGTVTGSYYLAATTAGWVDTGVAVLSGSAVLLTASGTYGVAGSDPGKTPASVGCSGGGLPGMPAPDLQAWAPIGRIGAGTPFCIGAGSTFTAVTSGDLYIALNDDPYGDNWGGITFQWEITR